LLGLGLDRLSKAFKRLKPYLGMIEVATGVFMMGAGILIVFKLLPYFNHYFNLGINV